MLNCYGRAISWASNLDHEIYEDFPELDHVQELLDYYTKSMERETAELWGDTGAVQRLAQFRDKLGIIPTTVGEYFKHSKVARLRRNLIKNKVYIDEFRFNVTADSIAELKPGYYCAVEDTVFEISDPLYIGFNSTVLVGVHVNTIVDGMVYAFNCTGRLRTSHGRDIFLKNCRLVISEGIFHIEDSLVFYTGSSAQINARKSVIVNIEHIDLNCVLEDSIGINLSYIEINGWINMKEYTIVDLQGDKAVIEQSYRHLNYQNAIVEKGDGDTICRKVKTYSCNHFTEPKCEYTNIFIGCYGYNRYEPEIDGPWIYHKKFLYLRDRTFIRMKDTFRQISTLPPPIINGNQTRFGIPWTPTYEEDIVAKILPHWLPRVLVKIAVNYVYSIKG